MSEHKIPDDLTGRYIELTRWDKGPLDDMQMPWQCSLGEEAALIERIAKLEAERDRLQGNLDLAADLAQQLAADNNQLRAALARMQQMVTDEERWRLATWMSGLDGWDDDYRFTAEQVNNLLAARAAGKGE